MMNLKAARFGAWIDRKHSVAEFLLPEDSQRNLADKLLKISNLLKTRGNTLGITSPTPGTGPP